MSQAKFAELLKVDIRTVKRLESTRDHHCLRPASTERLRVALRNPFLKHLLNLNRCPHPWPEDPEAA